MRSLKICLFSILICCLPLTAQAENKKIVVSCTEFASIDIEQGPEGYPAPTLACGDKCFYIAYTMEDATALRLNAELNANKNYMRELYIDDNLLLKLEPIYLDMPYTQKIGSALYETIQEAVDEARRMCPKAVIKVPEIVRY